MANFRLAILLSIILIAGKNALGQSNFPPQIVGLNGWKTEPFFTIGEQFSDYLPVGVPDGLGAFRLGNKVRILLNHEIPGTACRPYRLANGTALTGSRISFFDVDPESREILDAGLAYRTVIDRFGKTVEFASQINENSHPTAGFDRFCSAAFIPAGTFGLENDIFFSGEEDSGGGQEWALDVHADALWCLPWLGRARFENVAILETGSPQHVAFLIGDDRGGAPLLLYLGKKNSVGDGSFLDKNGLKNGVLHVWVAQNGDLTPFQFSGTGASRPGKFVPIPHFDSTKSNNGFYDSGGFATQFQQDFLGDSVGAFNFGRPEDVCWNPKNGRQAVFATTNTAGIGDFWGKIYLADVNFDDLNDIRAELRIIYDCDDAGGGQFSSPDFGLRNCDNLAWSKNGKIYVQEDKSNAGFGLTSGEEASIWELDPQTSKITRIAQVDRTAVPSGQTDFSADNIGAWETSGIVDVSLPFEEKKDSILLLCTVMAHGVNGGIVLDSNLYEGGQIMFLRGFSACPLDSGQVFPNSKISISPNPADDFFKINFHESFDCPHFGHISISDFSGKEVLKTALPIERSGIAKVELLGLAAGIYLVSVTAEGRRFLPVRVAVF